MTPEHWARVDELFHQALSDGGPDLAQESEEVQAELHRLLDAHRSLEEPPAPAERVIGGRYRLERLLGAGGSGEAWLSTDLAAGFRQVVLKLPYQWAWFRADLKRRFEAEAEALRRISDPAIVSVLDCGETDAGAPFLVMPYIDGEPLRDMFARGPVAAGDAADIAESLGAAVVAAHKQALVHRDIKPENVIVHRTQGRAEACLIDFGIALFAEMAERSSTTTRYYGTTQYMAPEQLLGKPGPESDIYAMALVIYEVAAGRPLFSPMPPVALYEAQRKLSEADLRGVPPRLRSLLLTALHLNPRKRPLDAAELGRQAARYLRRPGPAWLPSRRHFLAGGTAALAGGVWLVRDRRPVLESELRVDYQGGQTFRRVGWTPVGQVDSDLVEMNARRSAYIGNRVVSRRQGGYWRRFSAAAQRRAYDKGWRLRAMLRPVHGFAGISIQLSALGVRYTFEIAAPDRGPMRAEVVHAIHPRIQTTNISFAMPPDPELTPIEMRYDPVRKTAAVTVGGRLITDSYAGLRQYLDFPGIAYTTGQMESEIGEAIFGDLHFEMN